MIGDLAVWLRWAAYGDLALVFGVPCAALVLAGRRDDGAGVPAAHGSMRLALIGLALLGLGLTGLGFAAVVARMADVSLRDLDPTLLAMMLTGSALGWSVMARAAALAAVVALGLAGRGNRVAVVACGAVAVVSLAWGGHAAASQGAAGAWRIAGDGLHLLAGLAWLGAIGWLAGHAWYGGDDGGVLAGALHRFAGMGTLLVAALVITGLAHALVLAAPGGSAAWSAMAQARYGRVMLAKLGLFAAMLALAAYHRWHLVPALMQAHDADARRPVLRALRRSLCGEGALGLAVIWCVAYAGTLDPMGG